MKNVETIAAAKPEEAALAAPRRLRRPRKRQRPRKPPSSVEPAPAVKEEAAPAPAAP